MAESTGLSAEHTAGLGMPASIAANVAGPRDANRERDDATREAPHGNAEQGTDQQPRSANLRKTGQATKRRIVQSALQTEDMDQEMFLRNVRERLERVGMDMAAVEVRFQNLNIEASIQLGNRALPTVLNSYLDFFEGVLQRLHLLTPKKTKLNILEGISGIIPAGRMTLLLGPPGSGKSTLLQALAGKLQKTDLKVQGKIEYNGHTFKEFIPQRTASYISQTDLHLPELTVRETLDFSARSQGVGYKAGELDELHKREKAQGITPEYDIDAFMTADAVVGKKNSLVSEYIIRILGLDVCADTPVGNQMIRGISGGQKKRVTTGEMIVGPSKVLFMDEISTGLDSSTTFQIIKCLRDFAHLRNATVLINLLQPPPEVYNLFDDILLLSEGQIVYHGPRTEVLPFFASCGFRPPVRKATPDFLQEVTSQKDQKQYWTGRSAYDYVPVMQFHEAYQNSPAGQRSAAALAQPFDKTLHKKEALVHEKRTLTGVQALKALMRRELTLVQRNSFLYIFKAVQATFTSIICATLFLRTHIAPDGINNAHLYAGFLFFTSLQMFFNGIAEMTFTIDRMDVFFKQRDDKFFPTWAFVIPTSILRLPVSLVESGIFTGITYYAVGLASNPDRFFMCWLLNFLTHNMAISVFRALGAISRNLVVANAVGASFLMMVVILDGFIIPRESIRGWWIWFYWIDPLQFGTRALLVNEFTGPRWNRPDPNDPATRLGQSLLNRYNFPPDYWWVWLGVGVLIFWTLLGNVICVLAHQLLGPWDVVTAVMSAEALEEKDFAKRGRKMTEGQVKVNMPNYDDSARHSQLAQYSQRSLQAGRSFRSASSKDAEDVELGSKANSDIMNDTAEELRQEGPPATGVDWVGPQAPRGQDGRPGIGPGDGQTASQKRIRSLRGISNRSRASSTSSKSLSVHALGAAGGNNLSFRDSNVEKGMVLPFTPLTMTFTDVHYYVDVPAGMGPENANIKQVKGRAQLELLQGISGAFRPGVLTCLMGVSGAGKTTLMDVLAGRKTSGTIEGDIRMNGHVKEQTSFARVSGYVEQNDVHSPQTTVDEALMFSAELRFTRGTPKATVRAFVDEVMGLVELSALRHVLVGVPGMTGLSVEQRKRLTIAVELVANPSIVFMDEPTSGLDARAAAIVMRTVRNIVNTGRTIVCTIHQPSIDIFESFDELLLLKRGGQTIYAGTLGRQSADLVRHFEGVRGVHPIAEDLNPATWMLEVTTPGSEARLGLDFADIYTNSALFKQQQSMLEQQSQPDPDVPALQFDTKYPLSPWQQYLVILKKFNITFWRTPAYNATRFSFTIAIAFIFATVFWKLGNKTDTEQQITNTLGALYTATLFLGIMNSIFVQPVVSEERAVLYRERAAGMYSVEPWYLAMATMEAVYLLVQAVLYVCLVYFTAGFAREASKFFWFLLYMILTLLYFEYYGIMCVAITPNLMSAAVASNSFYLLMNLFSGFVIPRPHIPGWWIGAYWMDPVTWSLYGLVTSNIGDYNDRRVQLLDGTIKSVPDFLGSNFGYKHSWLGWVVCVLILFTVTFWGAGALAFKKLNFQQR